MNQKCVVCLHLLVAPIHVPPFSLNSYVPHTFKWICSTSHIATFLAQKLVAKTMINPQTLGGGRI